MIREGMRVVGRLLRKDAKKASLVLSVDLIGQGVSVEVDAADVKTGTLGTVQSPVPEGEASIVVFDGRKTPMLVLNASLEVVQSKTLGADSTPGFPAGARVRVGRFDAKRPHEDLAEELHQRRAGPSRRDRRSQSRRRGLLGRGVDLCR